MIKSESSLRISENMKYIGHKHVTWHSINTIRDALRDVYSTRLFLKVERGKRKVRLSGVSYKLLLGKHIGFNFAGLYNLTDWLFKKKFIEEFKTLNHRTKFFKITDKGIKLLQLLQDDDS